jgi:hypothetical protein
VFIEPPALTTGPVFLQPYCRALRGYSNRLQYWLF